MKLTNVEIKSTDSPLLHVNAEFETMRNAYSVGRYLGELVRRNEDVEILHKNANCCKPTTQLVMPVPEKIFRCGDATTVIWKDGTKTTVKLMPGAEDSDYGAFTAALAKKIYGGNGKVMRYAGMVQRVKSKAEKKAERKAKHNAEAEDSDYKKYIVSQYGQVAECKGVETEGMGVGVKVVAYAKTEDDARRKACKAFKEMSGMREYLVYSDRDLCRTEIVECEKLGKWCESAARNAEFIRVFAKNGNEALQVLEINPAPIPF
jgi:hypothetical protein